MWLIEFQLHAFKRDLQPIPADGVSDTGYYMQCGTL